MAGIGTLTVEAVEELAIEYLAANNRVSPDDIRRQLEVEDRDLPMDSLVVSEILAAVESRLGFSVGPEVETARAFFYVRAFARLIVEHGTPM